MQRFSMQFIKNIFTSLSESSKSQVHDTLIHNAYEQLLISSLATVVNAVALFFALLNVVEYIPLVIWFVLLIFITSLRYATAHMFRKQKDRYSVRIWENIFTVGVTMSALLWGSASIFLFVHDDIAYQAILIIILAGMSAGAISSLAYQLKAVQIFMYILLLPLIFQLFSEQTDIHNLIAMLVTLYLAVVLIVSKRYYNNIVKTIESGILFKEAKEQLILSKERFETIFKSAPAGIFFYDTNLHIIEINQEFASLLQTPMDTLIGLDMQTLPDTRIMPTIRSVFDQVDGYYEGEYHSKFSNIDFWITLRTAPVLNTTREVIGGIGIVTDITDQILSQQKIRRQAYYDTLTNIPNRLLLEERLEQAIIRFRRHKIIPALLFLDLDHFKKINDSLGHHAGDELLKESALRLQTILREEDLVARFGGDEFVILLNNLGKDMHKALYKTELFSKRVHEVLKKQYLIQGQTLSISSSIGIALYHNDDEDKNDLLKHADTAMYQAKKEGRGKSSFYQAKMDQWVQKQLYLEHTLRDAISKEQLELYYQPIIEFDTQRVVGAEALLRWNHFKLGFINPEEIISIAEESGLIIPLGNWVLQKACRQLKQWHYDFGSLNFFNKIAVNVSSLQFMQKDFVEQTIKIITQSGIDPSSLELELTESVIINNVEETIQKMQTLRDYGIGISIDDFGTGYSSLSYLKKLPFSTLKIDKIFTQDILLDADDAILIETMLAIAKNFKMHVVAEGVETHAQYAFLSKHHCHYLQGYLCSPPLTEANFTKFLQSNRGYCSITPAMK